MANILLKKNLGQKFRFNIGDTVRIIYPSHIFARDYDEMWTSELFKITTRFRRAGLALYKLRDVIDEDAKGTFYQSELQKVSIKQDKLWKN